MVVDRRRPVFARFYAWMSPRMDEGGLGALRTELLAELSGDVVEVGAGNGLNFAHYPDRVTSVVAVEPEPYLRDIAVRAAGEATVDVDVRAGVATRLPLDDDSADAAVLSLAMCSFDDRPGALAELRRVLRPGGTLRFFEHCIADSARMRFAQRVFDATFWPLVAGGCHTTTDPVALISAAGFTVTDVRKFRFPEQGPDTPVTPHVLGTAVA